MSIANRAEPEAVQQEQETVSTRCCIVGGGPAGMMLGFLLGRAGIDVVVLEKHGDFFRDFRGDTVHPSTLELMEELGLLDAFLQRPHQEARQITGVIGNTEIPVADFTHLPTRCKFLAFMPQWDFLDLLAEHARAYPAFHLRMHTEVTDVIEEGGVIRGVKAETASGRLAIRADLTVGADGRHSVVRERAKLPVQDLGAPIDVLWMRISRQPTDPDQPLGRFDRGRVFVMIYRGDYWQCGLIIPKGSFEEIRSRGLAVLRREIVEIAPLLYDRVQELGDWDAIKLLTVHVDRLRSWCRPGLLCIGDSAHAMSPVGGVGINLAIQDAVATANILAEPLARGTPSLEDLKRVQRRRQLPTRLTQRLQIQIQERVLKRVLGSGKPLSVAWPLKLVQRFPRLRRIPARVIGIGFRAEHIRTPDVHARARAAGRA
jgi:2-polyprenyl-6-methoxyphenol hydroxylase-like FAD-dependent oxidoreductase